MTMTAEQRVIRARLAAHAMHAKHDPVETTAKAREAFRTKFEREVDPDGVLPEAERLRRAESAKKAYYTRLTFAASRARQAKKSPKED